MLKVLTLQQATFCQDWFSSFTVEGKKLRRKKERFDYIRHRKYIYLHLFYYLFSQIISFFVNARNSVLNINHQKTNILQRKFHIEIQLIMLDSPLCI